MVTLYILTGVFIIFFFIQRFFFSRANINLSGRIAMSSMLLFTGIGHFVYTQGMSMMLPPIIPLKREIILFTGVIEFMAAIGLLIPRFQRLTSILLILFFIVLLPANIYAAMLRVNLQTANFDGKGPSYLWIRVPLQLVFIGWVWYFGYRRRSGVPGNT